MWAASAVLRHQVDWPPGALTAFHALEQPEEIVSKLGQAEVLQGKGAAIAEEVRLTELEKDNQQLRPATA